MLFSILMILLVLTLASGGWSYSRHGFRAMAPAGLTVLVLAILLFTGAI